MIRDWWEDRRGLFAAFGCGLVVGLAIAARLGRTEVRT